MLAPWPPGTVPPPTERGEVGGESLGNLNQEALKALLPGSCVPCEAGWSGGWVRQGNFTAGDSDQCLGRAGGHSGSPSQRWEGTMGKGPGTTPESLVCCLLAR